MERKSFMIEVNIPGRRKYQIENIVFDYNGTIALDGEMSIETINNIKELSKLVKIYILTADTYGTVTAKCHGLPVKLITFPSDNAAVYKRNLVESLKGDTICFGNGFNDIEMFKVSTISVCIMGEEGCSGKLITLSDIVVSSIHDGFELLFKTDRIKATLRG